MIFLFERLPTQIVRLCVMLATETGFTVFVIINLGAVSTHPNGVNVMDLSCPAAYDTKPVVYASCHIPLDVVKVVFWMLIERHSMSKTPVDQPIDEDTCKLARAV